MAHGILHIYSNDSTVSPWVPLKLSSQVISSRGSRGCERYYDHTTGKEKQPLPSARTWANKVRSQIFSRSQVHIFIQSRSREDPKVWKLRDCACGKRACDLQHGCYRGDRNRAQSRVSPRMAQQMTSCHHVLLTWNQVQGRHLQIAAMLDNGSKSRWSKCILLRKKPRMDDLSPGYLSSSSFSIMYRTYLAFLDVWSSVFYLSLLRENLGSEIPLMSSSENPQTKNSFLLLALSLSFPSVALHNHCQIFSLWFSAFGGLTEIIVGIGESCRFSLNYFSYLHNVWLALTCHNCELPWSHAHLLFSPFWKDNFPHFRALLWKLDSHAYCDLCAINLFPFRDILSILFCQFFNL